MTIIYTYQKSKKCKPNAKQRELKASWEELLKRHEPKKPIKKVSIKSFSTAKVPPGRETPNYPSLDSGGVATKPVAGVNDMAKFLRVVSETQAPQPAAQPAPQVAPSVANTDKAPAPEQSKAHKKGKKKKLKKKKARR